MNDRVLSTPTSSSTPLVAIRGPRTGSRGDRAHIGFRTRADAVGCEFGQGRFAARKLQLFGQLPSGSQPLHIICTQPLQIRLPALA